MITQASTVRVHPDVSVSCELTKPQDVKCWTWRKLFTHECQLAPGQSALSFYRIAAGGRHEVQWCWSTGERGGGREWQPTRMRLATRISGAGFKSFSPAYLRTSAWAKCVISVHHTRLPAHYTRTPVRHTLITVCPQWKCEGLPSSVSAESGSRFEGDLERRMGWT